MLDTYVHTYIPTYLQTSRHSKGILPKMALIQVKDLQSIPQIDTYMHGKTLQTSGGVHSFFCQNRGREVVREVVSTKHHQVEKKCDLNIYPVILGER